jgi:hypothetical protein
MILSIDIGAMNVIVIKPLTFFKLSWQMVNKSPDDDGHMRNTAQPLGFGQDALT